jgi:PAS domain S-box-containing protein
MFGAASFAHLVDRNLERDGPVANVPRAEFRRRLEADGEVRGLELQWLDQAGLPVAYVRENARVVRGPDGTVLYYEGTLEDVTERRRAEEALREREALLQSVIAHIPCAVFWKDRDSVLRGCNERFARDQGFNAPAALVGLSDDNLPVSPDEAEWFRVCDRRVMESGEPMPNIEETQTRPAGKVVLLTSKVPLRDAAGGVVGVLGVYQDITDRKQLEDHVRQKQKMEAVGQLAGGVAHDFNNLLTVINGYAELLLQEERLPETVRGVVAEMFKAGGRAAGLTRQLLTFGRRQVWEPRVLDLNAVVTETGVMLRRLIGEDVTLSVSLDPALYPVKVDPVQVQQVVLNLAVNARDAMPEGGRLSIETRTVTLDAAYARDNPDITPGSYAVLAVTDTGCGMSADVRARIFEPFFTTKGLGKGTGLGLATVYGIVKQSGGHISVASEVGAGTTFEVYFPRVVAAPAVPAVAADRGGGLPKGAETVLLAEDEPAVREVARRILRSCGYTVLLARDGEDALEVAGAHADRIDLFVTDVVMPKLGGRQAAEALRARRPGVRILYLSGYTDDAVVRHGVLEAGVAFLQKPFSPTALAAKVRAVLDAPPPPAVGNVEADSAASAAVTSPRKKASLSGVSVSGGRNGVAPAHSPT